jgi:hypothetical protein
MKIAEAVIVLAVVFLGPIGLGIWQARRVIARRAARAERDRVRNAPWEPNEQSEGEWFHVRCTREGSKPVYVGSVACNAVDFEERLAALRARQEAKLAMLNERRDHGVLQ